MGSRQRSSRCASAASRATRLTSSARVGPIGAYHLLHLCNLGSGTREALLIARAVRLPVLASFHAGLVSADTCPADGYAECDIVLSPSLAADAVLRAARVPDGVLARWRAGVDPHRFHPARYSPAPLPPGPRLNVLYVGSLAPSPGLDLLVEAFLIARDHDPRLHLIAAGRGPAPGRPAQAARRRDDHRQRIRPRGAGPSSTPAATCSCSATPMTLSARASSGAGQRPPGARPGRRRGPRADRHGSKRLPRPSPGASTGRRDPRAGPPRHPARAAHHGGLLAAAQHSWERSLGQLGGAYGLAMARSGALDPWPERLHAA